MTHKRLRRRNNCQVLFVVAAAVAVVIVYDAWHSDSALHLGGEKGKAKVEA